MANKDACMFWFTHLFSHITWQINAMIKNSSTFFFLELLVVYTLENSSWPRFQVHSLPVGLFSLLAVLSPFKQIQFVCFQKPQLPLLSSDSIHDHNISAANTRFCSKSFYPGSLSACFFPLYLIGHYCELLPCLDRPPSNCPMLQCL